MLLAYPFRRIPFRRPRIWSVDVQTISAVLSERFAPRKKAIIEVGKKGDEEENPQRRHARSEKIVVQRAVLKPADYPRDAPRFAFVCQR